MFSYVVVVDVFGLRRFGVCLRVHTKPIHSLLVCFSCRRKEGGRKGTVLVLYQYDEEYVQTLYLFKI